MNKNLKLSYFGVAPSYAHVREKADGWLDRIDMKDDDSIKSVYRDLFFSSRTMNDVVGMTILFHVMECVYRYWAAKWNDADSPHFRELATELRGNVVAYVVNAHAERIMTDDDIEYLNGYSKGLRGEEVCG